MSRSDLPTEEAKFAGNGSVPWRTTKRRANFGQRQKQRKRKQPSRNNWQLAASVGQAKARGPSGGNTKSLARGNDWDLRRFGLCGHERRKFIVGFPARLVNPAALSIIDAILHTNANKK